MCANFFQNPLHLFNLKRKIRVRCIYHVQQQIGIHRLLQSRLKGIYQAMRQVPYEAYRIRQRHRTRCRTQIQLPGGGVQGSKQLVCGIGTRFDQCVEQGGLARIRVADDGDVEGIAALALASLGAPLEFHFFKTLFGALDVFPNHSPVQLDLGFAWPTPCTDTATLALQV